MNPGGAILFGLALFFGLCVLAPKADDETQADLTIGAIALASVFFAIGLALA